MRSGKEKTVENYIVRIYRFQKDNPRGLVGIVESVEGEKRGKMAFTNLDDLWEILNSPMSGTALPEQGEVWQVRISRDNKQEAEGSRQK
jgi:hypothetical protein